MLATIWLLCLAGVINVEAAQVRAGAQSHARLHLKTHVNPIRKVVTLLQKMHADIEKQEDKDVKIFDEFMCQCKKKGIALQDELAQYQGMLPDIESQIRSDTGMRDLLSQRMGTSKEAMEADERAIREAYGLHDRDGKTFEESISDLERNIEALNKAIPMLEKGIGNAFLQTSEAVVVKKLVIAREMTEDNRDILSSFLAGDDAYQPQSGQIIGILKQMVEEMTQELRRMKIQVASATEAFEQLIEDKRRHEETMKRMVAEYFNRMQKTSLRMVEEEKDKRDALEITDRDTWSQKQWQKECDKAQEQRAAIKKSRGHEIMTITYVIELLNSENALDLFKKTLPTPEDASFLQLQATQKQMRQKALSVLRRRHPGGRHRDLQLQMLELALKGGKLGFDRIFIMIDRLVAQLVKDKDEDLKKLSWCKSEKQTNEFKMKDAKYEADSNQKLVEEAESLVEELKGELDSLKTKVANLDEEFAQQTDIRQQENLQFLAARASNAAATKILQMAKTKLDKTYNPDKYRQSLTQSGQSGHSGDTSQSLSFLQRHRHHHGRHSQRGPGHEAIEGIQKLIYELEKLLTDLEEDEKQKQEDYERAVKDTEELRADDMKMIADKQRTMTRQEDALLDYEKKVTRASTAAEEARHYLSTLSVECDFITKYWRVRKEARQIDIDSLQDAKAVLKGAKLDDDDDDDDDD